MNGRIAGMPNSDSDLAFDMFLKVRYLQERKWRCPDFDATDWQRFPSPLRHRRFYSCASFSAGFWRDLPLFRQNSAKGSCAPPFIPAADRRSGRIPALPYPPPR
jgi:hypothetical protein